MQPDTYPTYRKETLEEHKQAIDAEKERVRLLRDKAIEEGNDLLADILDKRIDDLQLEKDNLLVTLFGDQTSRSQECMTNEEIGALAIKATSGKLPHVRRTRGTWNTYEPEL